ncbi:MAG: hypothetical protein ABSH01_14025 [Terriglobia bacterium]
MKNDGSSRRDFLKIAGMTVAGVELARTTGLCAEAFTGGELHDSEATLIPFPSLPSVFEAPSSKYFGVKVEERFDSFGNGKSGRRRKLVPRDSKTYYLADGLSGEEEPHSFQLTFEITNNRILCSATQSGLLKNPCIFSRVVPARRRGRELIAEELLGGSAWSFGLIRKGGRPVRLSMTHGAQVELLGAVFPLFKYEVEDLAVRLLAFAPESAGTGTQAPRAILTLVEVHNEGKEMWEGSLLAPGLRDVANADATAISTPAESPHPRFTEVPVPIGPGFEAVMCLNPTRWDPRCPEVCISLQPEERAICGFALLLGTSVEDLRNTSKEILGRSAISWFNETWRAREKRYGQLSIPAAPYFSESYIRLLEADRSAILYSGEGRLFSGGPSGCVDFGMMLSEPKFLADALRSLGTYRPRMAGTPNREDLSYSLVNSLGLLPSASLYYRATDDRSLFLEAPGILEFARERLTDILALRQGEPYLFPSKMLWDGPTLGDYHTGSNIMAWLAFQGMGRLAREIYGEEQLGNQWGEVADKIKRDIYRHCVGKSRLGPRFFEGGNADGTFAAGHNGEEAFTTLAPFFGFCEADDRALINHAKLAFTEDNPLYEPAVDGIWWDNRGAWGSGITTPGQMAMLVAINNEAELQQRLDQLRTLTDLDGSIWWWPYLYPCNDRRNIRRRDWPTDTSKSGFTMAIASCLLANNVLGMSVDVPARRVALRPFCPWGEFNWERARLGNSRFDVAYKQEEKRIMGRITNRNHQPYEAMIELTLPTSAAPRATTLNGMPAQDAKSTTRFGRAAVRIAAHVAPAASVELLVVAA